MSEQIKETPEQELARLRAENAKMKEASAKKQVITCKVSEKGCLSVYGLGRFPVTLYKTQWEKLIKAIPEIQAFIEAHPELKTKEAA